MSHKVILKDAFKGYTVDQDKIVSPEQTVLRFKDKLKQVDLDILERTLRIDNGRLDNKYRCNFSFYFIMNNIFD